MVSVVVYTRFEEHTGPDRLAEGSIGLAGLQQAESVEARVLKTAVGKLAALELNEAEELEQEGADSHIGMAGQMQVGTVLSHMVETPADKLAEVVGLTQDGTMGHMMETPTGRSPGLLGLTGADTPVGTGGSV